MAYDGWRSLSHDQARTLFARREAGTATATLAAEVPMTPSGLRNAWTRLGLRPSRIIHERDPAVDAALLDLHARYARGVPLSGCAARAVRLNVASDASHLVKRWKHLGLTVRGEPGGRSEPDPVVDEILAERREGRGWARIYRGLAEVDRVRWCSSASMRICALAYKARSGRRNSGVGTLVSEQAAK